MKNTDYVVIYLFNNGWALIETEKRSIETRNGNMYIAAAKKSHKLVSSKREANGDYVYKFN